MPQKWLLLLQLFATLCAHLALGINPSCQCHLYLSDEETLALSLGYVYEVPCENLQEAEAICRRQCQLEIIQLNDGFIKYKEMMEQNSKFNFQSCDKLPQSVVSTFTFCNETQNYKTEATLTKGICCDEVNNRPKWCEYKPIENNRISKVFNFARNQPVAENRKLDTEKDQNAIENNEIEGSTKKEKDDKVKQEVLKDPSNTTTSSWINSLMEYFGYSSISELTERIDIFSIPQKIREAVDIYNDEFGMTKCYMEYTSYSLFTLKESPFDNFLRTRRNVQGDVQENVQENVQGNLPAQNSIPLNYEIEPMATGRQILPDKKGQIQTIRSMAESVVDLLRRSESTRQYADVISKILPMVLQVYSANDPQQALTNIFTKIVTPYLAQQMQKKPQNSAEIVTNSIEKNDVKPGRWPNLNKPTPPKYRPAKPASQSSGSSLVSNLVMGLVKNYIGSYMEGPKVERVPQPTPTAPPPMPPASSVQSSSAGAPLLTALLNYFTGTNTNKRPIYKPKPAPVKKVDPQPVQNVEKKKEQDFIDMVLEFVRPLFISIIGKTPGETGVESIREVSRLSTIGRVDHALKDEVSSPLFCFKNYVVNKAWTLTERGIRTAVGAFSPKEQERMKKMLF